MGASTVSTAGDGKAIAAADGRAITVPAKARRITFDIPRMFAPRIPKPVGEAFQRVPRSSTCCWVRMQGAGAVRYVGTPTRRPRISRAPRRDVRFRRLERCWFVKLSRGPARQSRCGVPTDNYVGFRPEPWDCRREGASLTTVESPVEPVTGPARPEQTAEAHAATRAGVDASTSEWADGGTAPVGAVVRTEDATPLVWHVAVAEDQFLQLDGVVTTSGRCPTARRGHPGVVTQGPA